MLARTANLEARISRVEFHVDGQAGHPPWGQGSGSKRLQNFGQFGYGPKPLNVGPKPKSLYPKLQTFKQGLGSATGFGSIDVQCSRGGAAIVGSIWRLL